VLDPAEHAVEGLGSVGDEPGEMAGPTVDPLTTVAGVECKQALQRLPPSLVIAVRTASSTVAGHRHQRCRANPLPEYPARLPRTRRSPGAH